MARRPQDGICVNRTVAPRSASLITPGTAGVVANVDGAAVVGRDTDGDKAEERAGERTADGACVVPHPAASATISSSLDAVANDFLIELAS